MYHDKLRTAGAERGVSRISARGVLKVTKSGGGAGGSPLQVRYTKSGGGGQFASGPGGGAFASGPIRKVEGGGGGGQFASGPIRKVGGGGGVVLHKENTLSLIINGYNFDQGGAQALHTRARMNLIVVFNFIHSLIVFILETEGGARAP